MHGARVSPAIVIRVCGTAWLLLMVAGCQQPAASTPQLPALPPDEFWQGKLVLSSPSLTAGIPGKGPLTLAEIKEWLADKQNHLPLDVALPLGLRSETP